MSMSLLLTSARGGMIFTTLLCGLALLLVGFSIFRVLSAGFALALVLGVSWLAASRLFPDFFHRITDQLQEEGLQTNRFRTFLTFAQMALDHPLGLGLDLDTVLAVRAQYGTNLGSAHNIYIDRAVQSGIFGLITFLALTGHIVLTNVRAIRLPKLDPERRRALTYVLLPVLGFLAAGMVEPVYDIGCKLTLLFWFVCGLSYTASKRALTEFSARPAAAAAPRWEPLRPPRLSTAQGTLPQVGRAPAPPARAQRYDLEPALADLLEQRLVADPEDAGGLLAVPVGAGRARARSRSRSASREARRPTSRSGTLAGALLHLFEQALEGARAPRARAPLPRGARAARAPRCPARRSASAGSRARGRCPGRGGARGARRSRGESRRQAAGRSARRGAAGSARSAPGARRVARGAAGPRCSRR